MATKKITVTVPSEVEAAVRDAVGDGNLSAYVAAALQEKVVRDAMARYAEFRRRSGDDLADVLEAAEKDLCS
jgi:hypothetical protein